MSQFNKSLRLNPADGSWELSRLLLTSKGKGQMHSDVPFYKPSFYDSVQLLDDTPRRKTPQNKTHKQCGGLEPLKSGTDACNRPLPTPKPARTGPSRPVSPLFLTGPGCARGMEIPGGARSSAAFLRHTLSCAGSSPRTTNHCSPRWTFWEGGFGDSQSPLFCV